MKSILCFGDSLTFGADPAVMGKRHAFADRWPSALEAGLGADKVRVIAEGLGGRTTVFDDWNAAADRNGSRILPTLLESHSPLDAIIIMLGTNDIKPFWAAQPEKRAGAWSGWPRSSRDFIWRVAKQCRIWFSYLRRKSAIPTMST